MKFKHIFKVFFILLLIISSCKKDKNINNGNLPEPVPQGEITGVGEPKGNAVSKMIGPAGGYILNDRVIVTIPAGALSKEVQIGLQPITNTNGSGKGLGYRLTPHGTTFAKPINLTFRYTDEETVGTFPQALGIAYQHKSGVWMAVGGVKLREDNKTVSINTTHFSDWSLFEFIHLYPNLYAVDPGQSVPLSVRCLYKVDESDILMPLTKEGIETALINNQNLLDSKYIDKWELQGEGNLEVDGNKASYFAPPVIPEKNPSEIVVKLKSGGKSMGLLVAKIYVAPVGVSVQADGLIWRTFTYAGAGNTGGINNIVGVEGDESIRVTWKGKSYGMFNWTTQTVTCGYILSGGKQLYQHVYENGLVSEGGINIEPPNEFLGPSTLLGTFNVKSSGNLDQRDPARPIYSTGSLKGIIRLEP